jgi:hypothetical protein
VGAGAQIQLRKGDWRKTIEKRIEIYQSEELEKFYAACTNYERLLFQTTCSCYARLCRKAHAAYVFEGSRSKMESAGIESRQFEELMISSPDGRDSPKLRTTSDRSGGTYVDNNWTVSSAAPRRTN